MVIAYGNTNWMEFAILGELEMKTVHVALVNISEMALLTIISGNVLRNEDELSLRLLQ